MATYVFEQMTQEQAAGFLATDFLVFSTATTTAVNIGVTTGAESGLQVASITLTAGGISRTFPASTLTAASADAAVTRLIFNDSSANPQRLILGTGTADTAGLYASGTAGLDVIYGFGGNDSLGGGAGNDYLYGGDGLDTLVGGDGADHIYGFALTGAASLLSGDGADSIVAGNGNDYVNGNGGADFIDGGDQNDRLNGGGGADTIVGGAGNDQVNGNLGDDSITGGSGNDILRGGQGNDIVSGGDGNDLVLGDVGADTVSGGAGFDVLYGGNGTAGADTAADVFQIVSGDAGVGNIASPSNASGTNLIEIIADYQDGTDKMDFNPGTGSTVTQILLDAAATPSTFGSLDAARTFAQELMDRDGTGDNASEVVALNFNGNTLLFATFGGTTIDTAIQVTGVGASVFDTSDFI